MTMTQTLGGFVREMAESRSGRQVRRGTGLMVAVLLLAGCPGTTDVPTASLPGPSAPPVRTVKQIPVPRVKPAPPPVTEASLPAAGFPAMVQSAAPLDPPVFPVEQPAPQMAPQMTPQMAATPPTDFGRPDLQAGLAPPPAVPTLDPRTLVGLDQGQTRRLLGNPAAMEEAPPAKVWRYAKGDCTLEVFFFMDMTSTKDFRALSYDMKSSQNVPDHANRCFAQLVAQAEPR